MENTTKDLSPTREQLIGMLRFHCRTVSAYAAVGEVEKQRQAQAKADEVAEILRTKYMAQK